MKKEKQEENNPEEQFGKVWLSAKAVVVDRDDEKVLVLKRSKKEKFHVGAYDLPGGHMDKGEGVIECLEREVRDETGLEVEVGSILSIQEYPKDHEMFNKIKALRFIAYYKGGVVELSEEHSKFEWLTFEEAAKKLSDKDYEGEKRQTILDAQSYLKNHNSVEKWQRAMADFENYKKQTSKQNEEFRKYAVENVIVEILPVLDNFQSALDNIPEEEQGSGWVTGMTYIQKQLLDVLNGHGVEMMEVKVGDEFDANLHEAIKSPGQDTGDKKQEIDKKKDECGRGCSSKESDEGSTGEVRPRGARNSKSKNIIITKVVKNGYKIGDKIVRPAMVEVE